MNWTIEYNDDLKIVILTYLGKVTGADIKEAAAARIEMGKQKGVTNFLIDTRKVEVALSDIVDIYEVPTKIFTKENFKHTNRIAIIEPKSSTSKELVKFYENACVNRGWLVMTFKDRESAIKWLQH